MSLEIERPYPVEGSIEADENVTSWSIPCESEWLSEHERGDVMKEIDQHVRATFGASTKAEFTVYEDGSFEITNEETLFECAKCGDTFTGHPGTDYYEGFSENGGELCDDCTDEFEEWLCGEDDE